MVLAVAGGRRALPFFRFCGYESRLARDAPLSAPCAVHPDMGLAVLRITAVMAVNGGFLLVLALPVQGGLGHSALRADPTFTPTPIVLGAVGPTWRTWTAARQRALTPAGFTLTTLPVAAVGLAFRGGDHGGAWLYGAYAGAGVGLALAFGPTLTPAPAAVRPGDAADAGGPLATVTQLGQLIGVVRLRHTVPEPA